MRFVFSIPASLLSADSPSALSIEIYASRGWYLRESLVGTARLPPRPHPCPPCDLAHLIPVRLSASPTRLVPYARANALFWADFIDKKVFLAALGLWKLKGEEIKEAKEFIENLKTIAADLGEKNYCGGGLVGFVDFTLVPLTSWFYSIKASAGVKVETECPKIAAWGKHCMERESVAKP